MSKSILVIETPKCCEECPLEMDVDGKLGVNICRGREKYSYNPDSKEKPDWCPLKEVPEKEDKSIFYNNYKTGYVNGFNACIDEILRENE